MGLSEWLDEPLPVLRIEIVRIVAPLAILGFMSGRLVHADEWIGDAGFRVPDLGGDWRQPLYVPALPSILAWAVAAAMVASGLACSLGYKTRPSALVFAATLAFVALSDRLAAFTVSKMSPAVVLAIAAGPAGTRLGVDARMKAPGGGCRRRRRSRWRACGSCSSCRSPSTARPESRRRAATGSRSRSSSGPTCTTATRRRSPSRSRRHSRAGAGP